jgi:O-antigen/teichoic acid export membrane protein
MLRITITNAFSTYTAAVVHRFRHSSARHTLITNVTQQICAALVILYLPNILGKADYAQVVYVSVLLSFGFFADAGISMTYGRVVPALLAQNNHDEVGLWNSTTLVFGFLASTVYSFVIAFLYYARYGHALNTLLLLPVPFVVCWFSFHSSRAVAGADFSIYRQVNSWRSISSLIVFPLALVCGLTGWFIATLTAALIALLSLGRQLLQPLGAPHWALVRKHLREGLMLSSSSVLWMQLLNFARLYASVRYSAEDIATYGIVSAAYQSFSTLIISVFLPVGVGLYSRYGESEEKALAFAGHIIARSLPLVMVVTVLVIVTAPAIFRFCFPTYHVDNVLLVTMLLSIVFYPFIMVYRDLMIARKHSGQFLLVVVSGMVISLLCSLAADSYHPGHGAAWGQLVGIMSYTLLLFVVISYDAGEQARVAWRSQACYLGGACALCAVVIGVGAVI